MKRLGHTTFAFLRRVGQLPLPFIRRFAPLFVVLGIVVGSIGSAAFITQSAHAAPEDFDTKEKCEDNEFTWDEATKKCTDPNATSCNVDGVGWIVCPVMTFLGDTGDTAFNFLADNFLATNVAYFQPDPDSPTKESSVERAWNIMRTLANVAFVIAFLVIIYSQLTSTGISNYGVKKMLPRLIIAAILVNTSYIICQIAIDISNVLGYSFKQMFESIGGLIKPTIDPDAAPPGDGSWALLIVGLLAGGITLWFTLGAGLIVAAVLALLMIVFILVARIALIIVLTVISPLAFVAFLLPNTEQWFKKWYKMFFALLLVFPIISIVFGASSLVAEIIYNTKSGDDDWMVRLTAMGVAAIPLFVVPGLLKNALAAAGTIGSKLANMANKQQSKAAAKAGSKAKERYDRSRMADAQRGIKNRMALGRARRRTSGLGAKLDNSKLGRALGLDKGAAAAMSAVDKVDEEGVSQELTRFKNTNGAADISGASAAMKSAISNGDSVKARAMQRYLAGAGGAGVKELESVYSKSSDAIRGNGAMQQSLASDALSLGMKGKSAAIDSFSTDGKRSFDDIQQDSSTYTRLGASELAGQKNIGGLMDSGIVNTGMAQAVMSSQDARDMLSIKDRQTMANLAGTDISGNSLTGGGSPSGSGGSSGGNTDSLATPQGFPTTNRDARAGRDAADAAAAAANAANGNNGTPSDGGGGGGAPIPAGWEEHSSGLIVPHGTSSGSSSSGGGSSPAPAAAPAPAASTPAPAPAAAPAAPQQPSRRQQAEQRAAEAAAGTSGSRPMVVGSDGGASRQTNQQADEAAAARESQPKIVDKRGGDRPNFFS